MGCGCKKNKPAEPTPQVRQITKTGGNIPPPSRRITVPEKAPEKLINEIVKKLKDIV